VKKGFNVTILAEKKPPHTTSDKAAAIWYPYHICPKSRALIWAQLSFVELRKLSKQPGTGVSFIEFVELFSYRRKLPWWENAVPDWRYASESQLPSNYKELGYTGGYVITVPLMETPKYMPWLVSEFKNLGGKIARKSRRISRLSELYAENQIIVNCTGLGASELCGDEQVYFSRAQVVRTNNPGICRGYADVSGPLNLAYIIPRTHDCILGGTADKNKGSERPNRAKTQEILYTSANS
jgi:D-amino-acid oxidase